VQRKCDKLLDTFSVDRVLSVTTRLSHKGLEMAKIISRDYRSNTYTLECEVCKKQFTATRRDARTCGVNCRKWLSRADERRQHTLQELHSMAYRLNKIAEEYPGSQDVYDQMVALYKLTFRTLGKFKTEWRQLEIPDNVEVKN